MKDRSKIRDLTRLGRGSNYYTAIWSKIQDDRRVFPISICRCVHIFRLNSVVMYLEDTLITLRFSFN